MEATTAETRPLFTIQLKAYLTSPQQELFEKWTNSLRPLYNLGLGLLYENQQRNWRKKSAKELNKIDPQLNIPDDFDPYPVEWHWTKALPECDWLSKEENEVRNKDKTFALACRIVNRDGYFSIPYRTYWHVEDPKKITKNNCYTNKWLENSGLLPQWQVERLIDVPMKVRQACIMMHLLEAWKRYEDPKNNTRKLKFKSRRFPVTSLPYKQTEGIKFYPEANDCLLLGKEFGLIKFRGLHNRNKGEIQPRTGSLAKKADGYYLNLVFYTDIQSLPDNNNRVGIDPGIVTLLTLSNGRSVPNPRFLKQGYERLQKLQRSLARQEKGGSNWRKTQQLLAKVHKKIADRRKYYAKKVSTHLVSEYDAIAIEDTKLVNMVRAPKAKKSEDGKGYEQNGRKRKAGLNKAIQDAGIGQIRTMLESKASNHPNREIVRVNAKNTSRRCSRCGHTEKENRETQASFKCLKCDLSINADLNAAINMEMEAFGYLDPKDE